MPKKSISQVRPPAGQKVFETEWFYIDAVKHSSSDKPYYRLSCNDSVVIIALTPEKKMLLIKQFRPAIGVDMYEWPAGQVDRHESLKQAVTRELKEETGYACDSLIPVGSHWVSPCRINSSVHAFIGLGARQVAQHKKEANIEVLEVSGKEFEKLLDKNGRFFSAPTMGFYFLSKMKGYL